MTEVTMTLIGYILFAIAVFVIIITISRSVNKNVQESLRKFEYVSSDLDLTC